MEQPSEDVLVLDQDEHPFHLTYVPVAVASFSFFLFAFYFVSPRFCSKYMPEYTKLTFVKKKDWDSRFISIFHSLVTTCMAYHVLLTNTDTLESPVWGHSAVGRTAIAITCGYMTSDWLIVLIYFPKWDIIVYSFHHFCTMFPYSLNLVYGPLIRCAMMRLQTEISTAFVNFRWFLDVSHRRDTNTYFINGLVLTFVFFLCRVIMIPFYWTFVYRIYTQYDVSQLTFVMNLSMIGGCLGLDILNVYWAHRLLRGASKEFMKRISSKEIVRNREKGN